MQRYDFFRVLGHRITLILGHSSCFQFRLLALGIHSSGAFKGNWTNTNNAVCSTYSFGNIIDVKVRSSWPRHMHLGRDFVLWLHYALWNEVPRVTNINKMGKWNQFHTTSAVLNTPKSRNRWLWLSNQDTLRQALDLEKYDRCLLFHDISTVTDLSRTLDMAIAAVYHSLWIWGLSVNSVLYPYISSKRMSVRLLAELFMNTWHMRSVLQWRTGSHGCAACGRSTDECVYVYVCVCR